ncbi:rRNA maturation protein Rpf1 [Paenibacillus phyllosphaerae]|uniref:rRNA maturation protein Rpf1 n=1 Tax=Paenibacillus phyllosphaerae TaxID=274593 RepID=A0A7W5ATU5_9BACL|nr:hypothetical protein [Paenibacillus phyllosphaerae]MBB3108497.1 rRNA maturation protein Rpf1 [Paenibacillus phyllosphaerae]
MALLLPVQTFNLGANVGKSYYEDLAGGSKAVVIVYNTSANPVNLVLYRVDATTISYLVPAFNSLSIVVEKLLVAALLTTAAGAASGTIEVATAQL